MAKPTNSNSIPGAPVNSGNTVLWDGPDIPCLGLCKNVSVNKAIYLIGKKLCDTLENLDLSTLDLGALVEACATCPNPQFTLKYVLQLLINKVNELSAFQGSGGAGEQMFSLFAAPSSGSSGNVGSVDMPIPEAMRYQDPTTETTVISLPLVQFLGLVANKVAGLMTDQSTTEQQIESMQSTISEIEEEMPDGEPELLVYPQYTTSTPGERVEIRPAFAALEGAFGEHSTATGNPTAIGQAVARQIPGLADQSRLSSAGVMGALPGWKNDPQSASDALTNLWLTMGDMRARIIQLQETQLRLNPTDLELDFILTFSEDRQTGEFRVTGSRIPYGWEQVTGTAALTLHSEGETGTYTVPITDIVAFFRGGGMTALSLSANGVAVNKNVVAELCADFRTADGSVTASKSKMKVYPAPCVKVPASGLLLSDLTAMSVTGTWAPPIGNPSPVTGYKVQVYQNNATLGWIAYASADITGTSHSVTGLLPENEYRMTVAAKYVCGEAAVITQNFNTPVL